MTRALLPRLIIRLVAEDAAELFLRELRIPFRERWCCTLGIWTSSGPALVVIDIIRTGQALHTVLAVQKLSRIVYEYQSAAMSYKMAMYSPRPMVVGYGTD